MREILFRGKRINNGEWVEGFYHYANRINPITKEFVKTVHWILPVGGQDAYYVIPETVGQYTGLTDKNGKKIFEGDIVKYEGYVYQCKWNEYNYEYVFDDGEGDFGIGYTSPYELEIIGNIHDNPELLKGGEQ